MSKSGHGLGNGTGRLGNYLKYIWNAVKLKGLDQLQTP